jgi:hypothetical protein
MMGRPSNDLSLGGLVPVGALFFWAKLGECQPKQTPAASRRRGPSMRRNRASSLKEGRLLFLHAVPIRCWAGFCGGSAMATKKPLTERRTGKERRSGVDMRSPEEKK